MKKGVIVCIVFLIVFALSLLTVEAASLTVCSSGCDSTTIQGAIDAASNGDTITISADTYIEQLTVNKRLTIIGAGDTTIISPGIDLDGIHITSNNVNIQDLKVITSSSGAVPNIAIKISGTSYVKINHTTIETTGNKAMGIWIGDTRASYLDMIDNTITINDQATGIYAAKMNPRHRFWNILGNTIDAPNSGVNLELYDVYDVLIDDNLFGKSGSLSMAYSSEDSIVGSATISNNIFLGNGNIAGVTPTIWIESDFISGDGSSSVSGIDIKDNIFVNWTNFAIRIGEGDPNYDDVSNIDITDNIFKNPTTFPTIQDNTGSATLTDNILLVEQGYSIQNAINIAGAYDKIRISPGIFPETLDINKLGLMITGDDRDNVIINASFSADYAIDITKDDISISNITLIGSQNYGIKPSAVTGIILRNITVLDSKNSGIDFNGVNDSELRDIRVEDTISGNGLAFTDSNNIIVKDIYTSGNSWGGIAVYTYGLWYPGGSDNIKFIDIMNLTETTPFYTEVGNYANASNPYPITNLQHPAHLNYILRLLTFYPNHRFYTENLTLTINNAVLSGDPNRSVFDIAAGEFIMPKDLDIIINNGSTYTNNPVLNLNLQATYANESQFSCNNISWTPWGPFVSSGTLTLPFWGSAGCNGADGLKTVYFRVRDNLTNVADPVFDTIILDTTPPTIHSILINNGDNITTSPILDIKINATDAITMQFSCNNINFSASEPYSQDKIIDLSSNTDIGCDANDGTKIIYALFFDIADNIAAAASDIELDRAPPQNLSILINDGNTLTSSSILDLNISGIDIDRYALSCNNVSWTSNFVYNGSIHVFDITTHSSQGCFAVQSKPIHVYLRAVDANDNPSYAHDDIFYSTIGPVAGDIIIIDKDGFTNDATPPMDLFAFGATSFSLSCDGTNFSSPIPYNTSYEGFNLNTGAGCTIGDGTKTIVVIFHDGIGGNSSPVNDTTFLDSTPPMIVNVTYSPSRVFDYSDVKIMANITDARLDSVWFESDFNGSLTIYKPSLHGLDNYTFFISNSYLNIGDIVSFRFYANDTVGNIASLNLTSFLVVGSTFSLFPAAPDCGDWYTVPPKVTLLGATGSNATFYYWGFDFTTKEYIAPFNESGIPGGIDTLYFWSTFPDGTKEERRSFNIHLDLTTPEVRSTTPINNSLVYKSFPMISARLHDVYFNNSEIDLTTLVFKVDGVDVTADADLTLFDYSVVHINYTPTTPMGAGLHYASIDMKDYACHTAPTYTWYFTVDPSYNYNLDLVSPQETIYGTRRIPLIVDTANNVQEIKYSLNNKAQQRLCKDCSLYSRFKTFEEGYNFLQVVAFGFNNDLQNVNHSFIVDSIPPRIIRTSPDKDTYVYGKVNFTATIYENLNITLLNIYTNITGLAKTAVPCNFNPQERYQECKIELDLSNYEGQFYYYFEVFDIANNTDKSKIIELFSDNIPPIVTINKPDLALYGERQVLVNATVSEDVKLSYSLNGQRGRNACTRCSSYDRKISFSDGIINLSFTAVDNAGHIGTDSVLFEVDSRPPKISRTYPDKDTYHKNNISFTVKYTELNLQEVILFYKHNSPDFTAVPFTTCLSGTNVLCTEQVMVPAVDGILEYYFVIKDKLANDTSKSIQINVDVTPPGIDIISPEPIKYPISNIDLEVDVLEKVQVLERSLDGEPFKNMCIRCDTSLRRFNFDEGDHTFIIRATDFAGNINTVQVDFEVDVVLD